MKRSLSRDQNNTTENFPSAFRSQSSLPIPSLPHELSKDATLFNTYDTDSSFPPPLSTTTFFACEKLNTSPHIMRASMYTIPADANLASGIGLPIYLSIQPFSHKQDIPEGINPHACYQCSSYYNPFSKINKGEYECNLCGAKNTFKDTVCFPSTEYLISNDSIDSKSYNIDNKVEMADDSYFRSSIFPTCFIFVFQKNSLLSKHLKEALNLINDELFAEQYGRVSICIAGYDILLYKVLGRVVCEDVICDVVPYVSSKYLLSVENAKKVLKFLLYDKNKLTIFPVSENSDYNDKINVQEISEEYKSSLKNNLSNINLNNFGEKENLDIENILNLISSLSQFSIGSKSAIFLEQQFNLFNKQKYIEKLNENNSSLFIFTKNLCGLEEVSIQTSGMVYSNVNEIKHLLAKSFFGVEISLKTSDGISRQDVIANTQIENTFLVKFSSMDSQSNINYTLGIDETMKEGVKAYVQVIVSYYNFLGEKKLLVFNHFFNASYKILNIYSDISFDTLFNGFVKTLCSEISFTDAENTKKNILNQFQGIKKNLVKSLKFYRNNASKNASESQMVLPESIKLMPLLLSCLMKNSVFFSTDYLSTRKIISMSIERNLRKFYPRIFSLSEYFLENKILMIQNSLANIQNNEVYVIDDGSIITLYIGREVEIEENELLIGEEGETIKELLQVMKNEYDLEMTFRVVRQGKGDYEVLGAMVEDKMNNVGAYNEFLCEMHFLVKDF